MNKWKKALSVGMSAALMASLFTVIAAGTVSASVSASSAGTFAPGTTSPNTVTLTFVERDIALIAGAGSLTVTINDTDGGNVTWSGTPSTAGSTGSLGASASTSGNVLTVSWTAQDPLNVETIVVSGLKIAADSTALAGPVIATLGGTFAPFFAPSATSTTTATGVIQDTNALTSGADSADILLSSVCPFQVTTAQPVNSLASFSDAADARAVTAAPAPVLGVQTVTFAAGTLSHPAGTTVTQTVQQLACGAATIPTAVGVIANALAYTSPQGNVNVFPGENNQHAGNLQFVEPSIGFLTDGTTITLHITTAGVTFSFPPSVSTTSGTVVAAAPLSADRTSATVTMSTASTVAATILVSNIYYDVASTVASGTTVAVTATVSSGKLVNPASRTNAVVGRVFNASAPTPNVNIGQNGQTAGLITITEVTAGSFTDGTGPNNVFEVCPDLTASFTSPGPSAFVTGGVAAGNLILRDGAAASTTNIVAGTPDPAHFGCYYWTVWTASTTASTITIGSSATVGPLVNVNPGFPPGALNAILYVGALATIQSNQGVTLAIANRVFPGQVKVTAVSQPAMAPGASSALAGDLLLEETGNGQLKLGTRICVEIVPNQQTGTLTDVFLSGLTTADLPVATAANGVVIGSVTMSSQGLLGLAGGGHRRVPPQVLQFHHHPAVDHRQRQGHHQQPPLQRR